MPARVHGRRAAVRSRSKLPSSREDTWRHGSKRVEGEVRVTARFVDEESGFDLTPEDPPELRFGVAVASLPEVRFSAEGGTVGSAEQISLGLSLARAYPTDIGGVLTLTFDTRAFTNDPSIQWVTGGRQAPFQILAGTTDAVFVVGEAASNTFQTGTVAGEVVVSARFFSIPGGIATAVRAGEIQLDAGFEITPDLAPEVRFSVLEAAPVLSSVVLGTTGQGRFTLQVTGYSTPRAVDSLSFSFSGIAGSDLRTPSLDAEVSQVFRTYYEGNQSVSYGSQFTATVAFTIDEGVFEDISSVSVTAANGSGASNSVSASLN